ncbi:MAG: S1/P1 nuclease [Ignavibacteriaceae bacterium]
MKKNKTVLFAAFLFFVFSFQSIYPWGEEGHKMISKMAVQFFPPEMKAFVQWEDYLSQHAPDPDLRKKDDKSEGPKHFIDIDFYKEFLAGKMIENEDSLIAKYGETEVIKNGVLPWATLKTFQELTKAFKEHDKEGALKLAADLGHYVADGHQPMHTVLNYNGQLTDQKGVHAHYEITMVDEHLKELEDSFQPVPAPFIKDPMNFIFNYISNSNSVCGILFDADNFAFKESGSRRSDEYYRLMWFRMGYITEVQFDHAAEDFASLVYTAWINGGKPSFESMK